MVCLAFGQKVRRACVSRIPYTTAGLRLTAQPRVCVCVLLHVACNRAAYSLPGRRLLLGQPWVVWAAGHVWHSEALACLSLACQVCGFDLLRSEKGRSYVCGEPCGRPQLLQGPGRSGRTRAGQRTRATVRVTLRLTPVCRPWT
jgi:hypothetical protein